MLAKVIVIVLLISFLYVITLLETCNSFHIATKIRRKHICGKKLIEKIFASCGANSVYNGDNLSEMFEKKLPLEKICCRGTECHLNVIAHNCDYWQVLTKLTPLKFSSR